MGIAKMDKWINADPQSAVALTGMRFDGGFYIVCNNADVYVTTYGMDSDQDIFYWWCSHLMVMEMMVLALYNGEVCR